MSKGRLTTQELGWLLAQEAEHASERLRRGVRVWRSSDSSAPLPEVVEPPPVEIRESDKPPHALDATLDALEDAVRKLSSLHQRAHHRSRRGRMDLAALVCELAPHARVSIETEGGTEVFADEVELRRMLHVMLGSAIGVGSSLGILREGDEVRLTAQLGPDTTTIGDVERAWLSRMAIRYGGRFELEPGSAKLTLPAEEPHVEKDREDIRRELDEGRRKRDGSARPPPIAVSELPRPSTIPPPASFGAEGDKVALVARLCRGLAGELRSIVGGAARSARSDATSEPPSGGGDAAQSWRAAVVRVYDLALALSSVGDLDPAASPTGVDPEALVRNATRAVAGRAKQAGVGLTVEAAPGGGQEVWVEPRAAGLILREALIHGVEASHAGQSVAVTASWSDAGYRVCIDDSGAPVPPAVRRAYVEIDVASSTLGRPSNVPLYLASELSAWQKSTLEIQDAPTGGTRVCITFPTPPA